MKMCRRTFEGILIRRLGQGRFQLELSPVGGLGGRCNRAVHRPTQR